MPTAPVADTQLLTRLVQDFRTLNYSVAGVEELLGAEATQALEREQAVLARRIIAQALAEPQPHPLAAVISTLMLGDPVPTAIMNNSFTHTGTTGLVELGLGTIDGDVFHPGVDLSPYNTDSPGPMWVASDQSALQLRAPLPADHVLGVGRASLTLAALVPRAPVATALDLGTGCGIQTLHLLAHAEHVIATDISQRALDFTRFNILLNSEVLDVDPQQLEKRVTLALGNMLEPVTSPVDLVVTNPPFVISPPKPAGETYTYRETSHTGDGLIAELISTVATIMNPGAQAVMLGNWEISNQTWEDRLKSWVPDSLDVWAIQRDLQTPAQYAETWLADSSNQLDPAGYDNRYGQYVDDFTARGVTEIGFGWVWLRRRQSPPGSDNLLPRLEEYEHHDAAVHQPVGPWWAAGIAAWDRIFSTPNSTQTRGWALADAHLQVPHHVTEERYQRFGAEHPEVIVARSGAGFGRSTVVDTAVAAVLSASDGEVAAGPLCSAVAQLLDLDAEGEEKLQQRVEKLVFHGYLEWA